MIKHSLNTFPSGWFVGDFEPSLLRTKDFEIGIKRYYAGQTEPTHHHAIACEFTLVLEGVVSMNGEKFYAGDIVEVPPMERISFVSLSSSVCLIVKIPSVLGDKYE